MRDIHNYEQRLEGSLSKIDTFSKNNQALLKEFVHKCELEELSKCRIAKYVYLLGKIIEWVDNDLDKLTNREIEDLVLKIKKEYSNEWTIKDYKVVIKKFYKSIGKEDSVSWIKTTIKRNNNEDLPNEVYTEAEVEKLIETANNPRDKAFISILYDSGCRISELLNVKVKDITFEQDYAMLKVMGKTGNRSIPISKSLPLLKTWLNYDKNKGKEDYVFDIKYKTILEKLQALFERANIDKPYNPHQFRHSRATELAKQLTEAQMNQFFGWTQASRMASTYVHLTGRDLVPKLVIPTKTKKCLKCGFENPEDLKFCSSCLMPLDKKDFKEKVEQEDIMKNLYNLAKNDREWLEFTTKRLQKMMK